MATDRKCIWPKNHDLEAEQVLPFWSAIGGAHHAKRTPSIHRSEKNVTFVHTPQNVAYFEIHLIAVC